MKVDRIVCLANSYKHDNRCVAGISLITNTWVRLVGRKACGCLTRDETRCTDGREPAILDVLEIDTDARCGSCFHPEDVQISGTPWRRIRRFDSPSDLKILAEGVSADPVVLQGYCDRVEARRFEASPAKASLALLNPDDLWWWIRDENGKRRYRANFRLGREGRIRFDLPVTDPKWLDQLQLLPEGIYPHRMLSESAHPTALLTASLSEAFEGFHYKLIAGVIPI